MLTLSMSGSAFLTSSHIRSLAFPTVEILTHSLTPAAKANPKDLPWAAFRERRDASAASAILQICKFVTKITRNSNACKSILSRYNVPLEFPPTIELNQLQLQQFVLDKRRTVGSCVCYFPLTVTQLKALSNGDTCKVECCCLLGLGPQTPATVEFMEDINEWRSEGSVQDSAVSFEMFGIAECLPHPCDLKPGDGTNSARIH